MKAILTLTFALLLGTTAMAQTDAQVAKVDAITMEVQLDIQIDADQVKENSVARLYKFKNTRIQKALKFRTKRNKSKIA